ncbi:MAG: ATP-binding cassette domain-containing protein [Bifidobacterium psychraerophilum]
MINKALLRLPGADLKGALLIGLLQTLCAFVDSAITVIALMTGATALGVETPRWLEAFTANIEISLLVMTILLVVRVIAQRLATHMTTSISRRMASMLADDLYLSLFDPQEMTTHSDRQPKETTPHQSMAMLSTEGVKSLSTYFTLFLPTLFESVLMLLVAGIVLIPLNPIAALIVILGMIAMPFAANFTRDKDIRTQVEHLRKYDRVGVRFEESLKGLNTLKIFDADREESKRLAKDSEGFRKATMALLGGQLKSLIGSDVVIYTTVILATVFTALLASGQTTGWLLSVAVAVTGVRLFIPSRQLVYLTHEATVGLKHGKAIAKARELREQQHQDAPHTRMDADTRKNAGIPEDEGLRVEHLDFSYPNGHHALHDLNFDFPQRGHLAIVGSSGSGKSTVAQLLSGRTGGYSGSMSFDGTELRDWDALRFIENVTMVRGSDHLFKGTVRSNLDPTNLGISDETLIQALERLDLMDLVNARGGLDSTVLAGGSNFSGGQRQRLAIARALVRPSRIYIFDEASSAIDREHDRVVSALMDDLARHSLVITVTHRLASIINARNIIVLDHGEIVDSGDFTALLSHQGMFAQQWEEQDSVESDVDGGTRPHSFTSEAQEAIA